MNGAERVIAYLQEQLAVMALQYGKAAAERDILREQLQAYAGQQTDPAQTSED